MKFSWDTYFLKIAEVVSLRSNCCKRSVGAVLVSDNRIISTGYNGTPKGYTDCCEGGCKRCNSDVSSGERLEECLCVHAEANSIIQAAFYGVSVKGATLYCTLEPCLSCSKLIVNAGIKRIVYNKEYPNNSPDAKILLETCGVEICRNS
jgi:dCMP deaminase